MTGKLTLTGLLLLLTISLCHNGQANPAANSGTIELFNAKKNNASAFTARSARWVPGDLTPVLSEATNEDGKWLKVSYKGTKGLAQLILACKPHDLKIQLPSNMAFSGVKFGIYYDSDVAARIKVNLRFSDKTILVKPITLKKGYHDYIIDSGFRRAKHPPLWPTLSLIDLSLRSNEAVKTNFLLKSISMISKQVKQQKKNLKIIGKKKVREIFESKQPLSITGKMSQQAWKAATPLRNFVYLKSSKQASGTKSPLQVRLSYDKDNLYVGTKARFDQAPPISHTTKNGSLEKLWADELIEYFFSGENDNQKKIQFVTNLNGAVWDSVVEFDVVAAAVIRKTDKWSLDHRKSLAFANNYWTTNVLFPLEKLKIDLSKERFMGFQIAQNYSDSSKTISWTATKKFPNPRDFGVLIFNKKPFGKGDLKIKKVTSSGIANADNINIKIAIQAKNVIPGNYRYSVKIAQSDYTSVNASGNINLSKGSQTKYLTVPNIKNHNGVYSIYVSLYNSNDDIKLAAVNVENNKDFLNLFGKKVFTVTPKHVSWGKGEFSVVRHNNLYVGRKATARTIKTAEIFAEKLYGYSGQQYNIVKGSGTNGITLAVSHKAQYKGKQVKLKKEGYSLKITPDNVSIFGADEPGLYYGIITFMQLLRMPMNIKNSVPVACAEILDWPDKHKRVMCLLHQWNFSSKSPWEERGIDYLINWLDRYVANNKVNVAILDVSSLIKYERRPEFNQKQVMYSLDDIRKLAKYCRDNFIEFMPRWQTGGHSIWWLQRIHPELREKGFKYQADVSHPEHNKIIFDCLLDFFEASGATSFNAGMDEWWQGWRKDETPDKLIRNKTRAQVFLDFIIQLNDFCKKHGVKIIMEGDMLYPSHNGIRYDVYKVIDRIPKDITITNWVKVDGAGQYFQEKGFNTWMVATGERYPKTTLKTVEGIGPNCYGFACPWVNNSARFNYALICTHYANFSWNCNSEKPSTIRDRVSSGKLLAAMENLAVQPNPFASEKIDSIDIKEHYSTTLSTLLKQHYPKQFGLCNKALKSIPTGKTIIGNIPMQLGEQEKNCVVLGKNKEPSIEVNRKCSSLIFLHTVLGNIKQIKIAHCRRWYYGYPVGAYSVIYKDGTSTKINLRLHDNILTCDSPQLLAVTLGCRYIMPLKNVLGNYNFAYQYEWVNPFPEKEIKEVQYLHDGVYNFDVALLGLSTRQVKKQ